MMKIAITGGIGAGKSFVCGILKKNGIRIFDCDATAKYLMRTDVVLQQQLTALIGPDVFADGLLNKKVVAQFLLQSSEHAQAIDALVHPAVARSFECSGLDWMECAILYEAGFDRLVDRVIAVTAPKEVRLQRVMCRDHISKEKAAMWMGRQGTQEELSSRADYVIVNDGTVDLQKQIKQIIEDIDQILH